MGEMEAGFAAAQTDNGHRSAGSAALLMARLDLARMASCIDVGLEHSNRVTGTDRRPRGGDTSNRSQEDRTAEGQGGAFVGGGLPVTTVCVEWMQKV